MTQQPLTKGTSDRFPCPWCNGAQSLKDLEDYGCEPGAILECDHCKKHYEIKRLQPVTVVWVGRFQGTPRL